MSSQCQVYDGGHKLFHSCHICLTLGCLVALNLLQNSIVPDKTKTVVEYSSGSTVLSMSLIARAFYGLPDVRAFLSNKTSVAKIRLMQLFGINMYVMTWLLFIP